MSQMSKVRTRPARITGKYEETLRKSMTHRPIYSPVPSTWNKDEELKNTLRFIPNPL